jgi:enamine deaminase RidA (YjgF/YER057c/UK114 family)
MSESVTSRLAERGWVLPEAPVAVGAYVAAVRSGSLVFTSGQLPVVDGALATSGAVGESVTAEDARACAEICALRCLAAVSTVVDLEAVVRVVKVTGYVASLPDFTAQPAVIDGASEVVKVAFGEAGSHAREAVGVSALPLDAPVEVSMVLEVR